MKYEFDGISTETCTEQDNKFVEVYESTLISKEATTVELDDKEVQIHVYIEDTDMSEYEDTQEHYITMGVVPSFNSLSEKHQQDILSQFSEEEQGYIKQDTYTLLNEAICYGFAIPLHTVKVENPDDVEHTIQSAKAVHTGVTGLIGFELDKHVNRIGNTGWDFLDDFCNDKDIIKLALNRYN